MMRDEQLHAEPGAVNFEDRILDHVTIREVGHRVRHLHAVHSDVVRADEVLGGRNLVANLGRERAHARRGRVVAEVDVERRDAAVALRQGAEGGERGEDQVVREAEGEDLHQRLPVHFHAEELVALVRELYHADGVVGVEGDAHEVLGEAVEQTLVERRDEDGGDGHRAQRRGDGPQRGRGFGGFGVGGVGDELVLDEALLDVLFVVQVHDVEVCAAVEVAQLHAYATVGVAEVCVVHLLHASPHRVAR